MNIYIQMIAGAFSGGIVSVLGHLIAKTYFVEKIKASIKNDYDVKLENLRSELAKSNSILNTVLTSHNQGFQHVNIERIESIKLFWKNYLTIKDSIKTIEINDSTLLESELNTLYTPKWIGNDSTENQLKTINFNTLVKIHELYREVEKFRPFLNEELWLNFTFLDTFCGRIIYLYKTASDSRKFSHWKNDSHLLGIVKNNLTEKEYNHILSLNINSIKTVLYFIEQKLLSDLTKITSGQIAADNTYNQALRLIKLSENQDDKRT